MKGRFLFLGTGGSLGIPVAGCHCKVCLSSSTFNQRLRPSALMRVQGKNFLIDVGPDFRSQALRYRIEHLDGILLTHTHNDHIAGLDDLRAYYFKQKKAIPCLLSRESYVDLKKRYHYLLDTPKTPVAFSILDEPAGEMEFAGLSLKYLSYSQAGMQVLGFYFKNFAYITDIQQTSEEIIQRLKGVEILIVSALRWKSSKMHFNLGEGIDFAKKVGARKTWFIHIAHDLDYDETNAQLPEGFFLSYDGLEIDVEVDING